MDFERIAILPKRDDVRGKILARPFLAIFDLGFDQVRRLRLHIVHDTQVRQAGARGGIDIAIQREGDDLLVLGRAAVDGLPEAETGRGLALRGCRREQQQASNECVEVFHGVLSSGEAPGLANVDRYFR